MRIGKSDTIEDSLAARCLRLRAVFAFLVASQCVSPAGAELSESSEARYLAGLRERRLFTLTESYCRRRLADAYTVDRRRAELTVELSRTALEAALFTKPPEREARFADAARVLDDEERRKPNNSWKALLLVQRGVVELVWGERLREEAQTLHAGDAASEQAREHLRAAAAQFKQVDELAADGAQDAARRPAGVPSPDAPSLAEWGALRRQIDYHRARTQRNLGESYPPRSPDRLSALEQAAELLAALSRAEATDALTWQARLDEAYCRRLLGDLAASERVLDLLDGQSPPPEVADRARAERIRNRVAAARLDDAPRYFQTQDTEPVGAVDPEVRLAELEWLIASATAAERAKDGKAVAELRERAAAMARLVGERHAPYFARRAEALLAAAVGAATTGTHDEGVLARAAESFYRQGNTDKALELYDQLFAKARAAGQLDAAFDAAFTAAALEQQRRRPAAAADRFEKLAAAIPAHARSGEASLLAAFNLGQALVDAADPAAAEKGLDRYVALLTEHVKGRPTDRTTPQARLWLARVSLQRREPRAALDILRGVPASDPFGSEIVGAIEQAADMELAASRDAAARATIAHVYADALEAMSPAVASPTTTEAARQAMRAAARLRVLFCDDRVDAAADSLRRLLEIAALPDEERSTLTAWLAAAEAGAGRPDAALKTISKLKPPLRGETLPIVARLDAWAARAPVDRRDAYAALVLRFVELLQPLHDDLLENWIMWVAPAEARALAHSGRATEARRVWDDLAARRPGDTIVQEGYAAFLLAQPDRESIMLAAARWRALETATREATPAWYRARLATAEAYQKLGDAARARQIVELTAALHPDLGGPELKRQFEAIMRK